VIVSLEQNLRLKEKDVKKLVPAKISEKLATYNWTVQHVIPSGRVSNFPVNDVCLMKDEDAFRSEWRLASVVEV
jgi:hypothetical protein